MSLKKYINKTFLMILSGLVTGIFLLNPFWVANASIVERENDTSASFFPVKDPTAIKIGNTEYTRIKIISDFINIAFADTLWGKVNDFGMQVFVPAFSSEYSREFYNKHFPWLTEYVFRDGGVPDNGVINKWKNNVINVSIFLPRYGEGTLPVKPDPSFLQKIQEEVDSSIKEVSYYSGIKINYLPNPNGFKEGKDYARIRLLPTIYSNDPLAPHNLEYSCHGSARYLCAIFGGVKFLPKNENDVSGFFIPEADNSIGISACYIGTNFPNRVIKTQISNCLYKSMGLPNFTGLGGEDSVSYNRFLLSLLYCPKIKPDMSKNDVIWLLNADQSCFNFAIRKMEQIK